MLDFVMSDTLNDIRRAAKSFIVHKDYRVNPTGNSKFIITKKLKQQVEKEVMLKIKKKNQDAYCVCDPVDNKYNYMSNRAWALSVAIYECEDNLAVFAIYNPLADAIFYYVKDSGFYIQRNNRIEQLLMPKSPCAIGAADVVTISSSLMASVINKCEERKCIYEHTCSGSIYSDVVDFMLGRVCTLFIGDANIKKGPCIEMFKQMPIKMSVTNGVLIVHNPNAPVITAEDEEETEDDV